MKIFKEFMMKFVLKCLTMSCCILGFVVLSSCQSGSIKQEKWGEVDGKTVWLYHLDNGKGMTVSLSNFGATVQSLFVPSKKGVLDISLGYNDLESYISDGNYFGATVGRYANRIAKGKFSIDNNEYTLFCNNGENTLHGGKKGLNKVLWNSFSEYESNGPSVVFEYLSVDGEEGYPGNVNFRVVYTLTTDNELKIVATASTDEKTVINISHHSYFNLNGEGVGTNETHLMKIFADYYTPIDETLIPTGEIASVTGTPFDFRIAKPVGQDINADDVQIQRGAGPKKMGGYDHNWVINDYDGKTIRPMCEVYEPSTGIELVVLSQQPGMQFYSGNFLDSSVVGKNDHLYSHRGTIILEPQNFPDAPNQQNFPSSVLSPGEVYQNTMVYRFSVADGLE